MILILVKSWFKFYEQLILRGVRYCIMIDFVELLCVIDWEKYCENLIKDIIIKILLLNNWMEKLFYDLDVYQ